MVGFKREYVYIDMSVEEIIKDRGSGLNKAKEADKKARGKIEAKRNYVGGYKKDIKRFIESCENNLNRERSVNNKSKVKQKQRVDKGENVFRGDDKFKIKGKVIMNWRESIL